MARGFCVDCNYDGPLEPTGDCSRCGSSWTTASMSGRTDEDEWGVYEDTGSSRGSGGMDLSASDLDVYEL